MQALDFLVGAAGFDFSNEKRQKMAICSPVCSPVRSCSPVFNRLSFTCHGQTSAHPLASHSKGAAHPAPAQPKQHGNPGLRTAWPPAPGSALSWIERTHPAGSGAQPGQELATSSTRQHQDSRQQHGPGQPLQGRSTPSTSPARPWLGAAACLGPKTGTPLGGLRNSPKGRLHDPHGKRAGSTF